MSEAAGNAKGFDVYLLHTAQHWRVRAASQAAALRIVAEALGGDFDVLMDPQDPHDFYRLEAYEADEEDEDETID